VLLTPPSKSKCDWKTPSGRIEILSDREPEPLPRLLATHAAGDGFPLRLQPATTPYALNSSFYEQDGLREKQECMALMMHPQDAAARGLTDGRRVIAYNDLGEVVFVLKATERVPAGTVVTEGVWWREFIPGRRGPKCRTLRTRLLTTRTPLCSRMKQRRVSFRLKQSKPWQILL